MIGEQLLAHWHLEDSNFFFLVKSLVTRFHSCVGCGFVCVTQFMSNEFAERPKLLYFLGHTGILFHYI